MPEPALQSNPFSWVTAGIPSRGEQRRSVALKAWKNSEKLQNTRDEPGEPSVRDQQQSSITSPLPPYAAEPALFIFTFPLAPHRFLHSALLLTRQVAEWKKESANRQVRAGLSRPRLPGTGGSCWASSSRAGSRVTAQFI